MFFKRVSIPTHFIRVVLSSEYLQILDFFDKEYILISRRYQLHSALQQHSALVTIQMHIAKKQKKNYKNEKSRFSDQFLVAVAQTPPR
jgi:hypothetical protein